MKMLIAIKDKHDYYNLKTSSTNSEKAYKWLALSDRASWVGDMGAKEPFFFVESVSFRRFSNKSGNSTMFSIYASL